jgi:radical SAM superfamily enzyme YgiQ (UPF0313 family)
LNVGLHKIYNCYNKKGDVIINRTLIVSFDYQRKNEPIISYSVASLIAYLKENIGRGIIVDHFSFNMFEIDKFEQILTDFLNTYNILEYDVIAVSLYCWCIDYVKRLLKEVKKLNPQGKVYLGGYEVQNINSFDLKNEYPECDGFILGDGEESLRKIINGENSELFIDNEVEVGKIPPIYSNQYITIDNNVKSIRLATKRGCYYHCSYCAHKDLIHNSVREYDLSTIIKEFQFLNRPNIEKVNIIDPVFNSGNNFLVILEKLNEMNFKPKISLQIRAELIPGDFGEKFLNLVSHLNCILEFGIQTTNSKELKAIGREAEIKKVKTTIRKLNKMKIEYLVSFIYGLPYQNLRSLRRNIKFCKKNHIKNIEFNRLMLLKGTELYEQKDEYKYTEESIGGISFVRSSKFFSEAKLNKMKRLVSNYEKHF